MTPRSSLVEQALVVISILGAMILAAMALVVHHVNDSAAEAVKRSIRTIEVVTTLDKLQLALRDGDMVVRDGASGRSRFDTERYESARFEARLDLAALGPLTSEEPAQSDRLSHLTPLINRHFGAGPRGADLTAGTRDDIDGLIAALRREAGAHLQSDRETQVDASRKSMWIMIGALTLVSLLSVVFWALLKIEFAARRALEARLIASAITDELTGVANRNDFDHKLVEEWAFRARYATALSLLLIGVDGMKQHNDEWGPLAGDAILRDVARRLASRSKHTDRLARSGGDQFAILTPQHRADALALAEELRGSIAEAPFRVPGLGGPASVRVTVSVGVVEASDVEAPRALLAAAEEALHAAKQRGRDRVQAFRVETAIGALRATTGHRTRRDAPRHDDVIGSAG